MVERASQRAGDGKKLDVSAWTDSALELLAKNGIDGVRVELLAKELKVTKGSFYWHFKDRDALFERMLNRWRQAATLALIERLDRKEASAKDRLSLLLRLPLAGRSSARAADVELAIRLWGRRDQRAREALREVDQLRLCYLADLIRALGASDEEAEARAILAYSYMRVAPSLVSADAQSLMERCEALIAGPSAKTVRAD